MRPRSATRCAASCAFDGVDNPRREPNQVTVLTSILLTLTVQEVLQTIVFTT
jgi:hypothetical protein